VLKAWCRAKVSIQLDFLKNPEEVDDKTDAIQDKANPDQTDQCKLIVANRISHTASISSKVRK
jgi:hypothetical protein